MVKFYVMVCGVKIPCSLVGCRNVLEELSFTLFLMKVRD